MLKGVFVFIGLQQATSVNDFTNTCGHVLLTLHITLPKPSAISRQNLEVRASHCAALSHQNDNNIAWGQPHWSAIFAVVATSLRAHYSMHVYSDRAAHVVAVAPAAHRSHYKPRRELYVFRLLLLVARLKALCMLSLQRRAAHVLSTHGQISTCSH